MSKPFFDLDLVASSLAGLVSSGAFRSVRVVGARDRIDPAASLSAVPAVLIFPEEDRTEGAEGMGIGRQVVTTIGVAVQIRNGMGDDTAATDDIQALRTAVYGALDGLRPDPDWGPLLWTGGIMAGIDATTYTHVDRYQTESPLH